MPTLTPTHPTPTRGLNHYDGAPLLIAATLPEAQTAAADREAARAVLADIERRNGEARYKLAKAARLREEARKAAAPTVSPFPAASPEKRERLKRAQMLKGANTREAAHIAAESMVARKLYATLPKAMKDLARHVSESIPLPDARPEDILAAWLKMDPNPLP
mgnify:CR=1 FL=1